MRYRQLEAFRAVMLAGSVTQAAEMLNVSQPAVSFAIRQLEHAIGKTLFHRGHRKITLSDEGERLLAACRQHLYNVVMAALETGCRKQELLSLQWSQVHWERNELFLPGTKTKTKRPRRIPISEALHAVLVRRRSRSVRKLRRPISLETCA